MSSYRRVRPVPTSLGSDSGLLNERVLIIVFESIKWDLRVLCSAASVSRKLRAVARRLLWRELCAFRAPRIVSSLSNGSVMDRLGGGWQALAKLLFFCSGCEPTRRFEPRNLTPGHLVKESRFSKTSGRSFLPRTCRGDLLYVSDPCEHTIGENQDDLGIFRGVFGGFMRSRTRACLIGREVAYDERVVCPCCEARVWSMTAARLVPRCAARRLGARDGGLEYFVCVNGHLHGTCWLVRLSSDEEDDYSDRDSLNGDEDIDSNGDSNSEISGSDDDPTVENSGVRLEMYQ